LRYPILRYNLFDNQTFLFSINTTLLSAAKHYRKQEKEASHSYQYVGCYNECDNLISTFCA
jgi:hypothetical protein